MPKAHHAVVSVDDHVVPFRKLGDPPWRAVSGHSSISFAPRPAAGDWKMVYPFGPSRNQDSVGHRRSRPAAVAMLRARRYRPCPAVRRLVGLHAYTCEFPAAFQEIYGLRQKTR